MGESGQELSGPDLSTGIAGEDLKEGQPLLGHADGEPVMVTRTGGEVHAIGAVCTHYGGPLSEGLIVGETVRCPWHHACFSLRTGEAAGAPALSPVPRWEVETRDGRIRVTQRRESAPLSSRGRRSDGPETVVIIGAGAAGSAAAEMFCREGYEGGILLIERDRDAPSDRPNLSKDYLAGTAPEDWIPLRPAGYYEEHGVARVHAVTQSIDTGRSTVTTADAGEFEYGALLIATGAIPRKLNVPGAELAHVLTLRNLADTRAIINAADAADAAVIVGASFIGMEAAASLRTRGLDVTVVAPESVPFKRTLGEELGRTLLAVHEENGVDFRLGRTIAGIEKEKVILDDGESIPARLVVVGVGVDPDTRLAADAGLDVSDGVVVNEFLRTSDPQIYAAGDIARWPQPVTGGSARIEHWVVAQRQGQAAARNILGQNAPYTDVPFFWTQHFDMPVAYVGHAEAWDDIQVDGDPARGDAAFRYRKDGRTLALATIGRDRESLEMEAEMEGLRLTMTERLEKRIDAAVGTSRKSE